MPVAFTSHCGSQKCHHTLPDASGCLWSRAWGTCLLNSQGRQETFFSVPFIVYLSSFSFFSLFSFIVEWGMTEVGKRNLYYGKKDWKQIINQREGFGRAEGEVKYRAVARQLGETFLPHLSVVPCDFLSEAKNKIICKNALLLLH